MVLERRHELLMSAASPFLSRTSCRHARLQHGRTVSLGISAAGSSVDARQGLLAIFFKLLPLRAAFCLTSIYTESVYIYICSEYSVDAQDYRAPAPDSPASTPDLCSLCPVRTPRLEFRV